MHFLFQRTQLLLLTFKNERFRDLKCLLDRKFSNSGLIWFNFNFLNDGHIKFVLRSARSNYRIEWPSTLSICSWVLQRSAWEGKYDNRIRDAESSLHSTCFLVTLTDEKARGMGRRLPYIKLYHWLFISIPLLFFCLYCTSCLIFSDQFSDEERWKACFSYCPLETHVASLFSSSEIWLLLIWRSFVG